MNLCYIHVYKCGGTSMREHIKKHLVTPDTDLVDQWAYGWERKIQSSDRLLGNLIRSECLRFAPRHAVVLTHSFFYEFMKGWAGFSFATLLRDPVRRVLSQFSFQKRTFEDCRSDEFLSWLDSVSPFEFNMQTAAFCGAPSTEVNEAHLQQAKANLHWFDFVGMVDDYDASLRLFNRIYSIQDPAPAPRLNVTPEPLLVSDDGLQILHRRCEYDLKLLHYARRLFRAKVAALEMLDSGDPDTMPPSLA